MKGQIRSIIKRFGSTVLLVSILLGSGRASFDKSTVRATADVPEPARVDEIHIAYDAKLPKYVLVVEPVRVTGNIYNTDERRSGTASWSGKTNLAKPAADSQTGELKGEHSQERHISTGESYLAPETLKISAQLVSALSAIDNFRVMSHEALQSTGLGHYAVSLKDGDVGPFVIRARITEYSAVADASNRKLNVLVYGNKRREMRGIVGIDLEVLDGRDGSIATSFPVHGTFVSKNQEANTGVFSFYSEGQLSQSVLDQALRVALNDAATKLFERLSQKQASKN